ncbi:hypothetical protein [Natronolimnohabitans innermongolicus]|uniref:Uncharacterized protein n=1 Tax=Natronolimnohabitans innermongolicus JCM 12255 TaxID=1227499 RepID=L9WSD6_9EURY|nr:hypothetical protein [Natronolimnohabitans innermongolicus]ELY52111.1 hypothetical protein C493_16579 [Natronolimnohabitans innermongolicus JCM 12255]
MSRDRLRTRRSVLAAVGATSGVGFVGATVSAQDRDPTDYDRPRTLEDGGVEVTMHDCSRVLVDGDSTRVDRIDVHVMYPRYGDSSETWLDVLDDILTVTGFDLPVDINVNAHLDEFDPPEGAAIITHVEVHGPDGDTVVSHRWPTNEWDCREITYSDIDPEAAREETPIEYEYETALE